VAALRLPQLLDDQLEEHGRDGEIVCRARGRAQRRTDRLERRRIGVVAADVAQQARELAEGVGVEGAVLLDALPGAGAELLQRPALLRHPDHRDVEMPPLHQRLQRREYLLVGEVARRSEEDQRVGLRRVHFFFSRCPPN
jgi:hypothetical protein